MKRARMPMKERRKRLSVNLKTNFSTIIDNNNNIHKQSRANVFWSCTLAQTSSNKMERFHHQQAFTAC